MKKMKSQQQILHTILILTISFLFLKVSGSENPFSPKAHLKRYWNNKLHNAPRPDFLFSKASPLTASESARFAQLATQNTLSTHLDSFCQNANLLCFPDSSSNISNPEEFESYSNRNFTNYGTNHVGGTPDSFSTYSTGPLQNVIVGSFRTYSRDSTAHGDQFTTYGYFGNLNTQRFNTYGVKSTGGAGDFQHYTDETNIPDVKFAAYSTDGVGRKQSFNTYATMNNVGNTDFANYGKRGKSLTNSFSSYANSGNGIESGFSGYSNRGISGTDNFTSYGDNHNTPQNNFKNYGREGKKITESFSSYRDNANTGGDSFQSYARESRSAEVKFANYGQSLGNGTDKFSGYGNGAKGQKVDFKTYGFNNTFKSYSKDGSVAFSNYNESGKTVNKWIEPGKFFREEKLKTGTIMSMPDIKDKMPKRSFLPRSILSKLPFSSSKILDMKQIFHASKGSTMERMLNAALQECERAPSAGETKRCVGSVEDMIDFVVSVLGDSVQPRTTENTMGSKSDVIIGKVTGINGGKVTQSVSCHQSLYPYLLYYCHSVPKVRVYEADILDPNTKVKINHGVAICHLDTSAWSASHGAFIALGSGPGKIEVCHWIFENDLTWTVSD